MTEIEQDILLEMVRKDRVIFAPKSDKELKEEYPELKDYPEFVRLSASELLFVWWYACQSSPIIDLPEEKRFPCAIEKSFKGVQQEERKQRYAPHGQAPDLPGELKEAIRTMSEFNPFMRISMAVDNMFLLKECQSHIRQEKRASQEDREDYLKVAALARKIMGDILHDIERGNHGVEEVKNTTLVNLEGVSGAFHKSRQ